MTREEIAEIQARADAATPGPWETPLDGDGNSSHTIMTADEKYIASIWAAQNAIFCANARTDIPTLLSYVAELEAENTRQRDARGQQTYNDQVSIEELRAERDAAVEDLKLSAVELQEGMGTCVVCEHYPKYNAGNYDICNECASGECLFKWRGKQNQP